MSKTLPSYTVLEQELKRATARNYYYKSEIKKLRAQLDRNEPRTTAKQPTTIILRELTEAPGLYKLVNKA